MKKIEMQYPVEGSTALAPHPEEGSASCGNVIAFPGFSVQGKTRHAGRASGSCTSKTAKTAPSVESAAAHDFASAIASRPADMHGERSCAASHAKAPRHAAAKGVGKAAARINRAARCVEGTRLMQTDVVQSLRHGSAQGVSFGCMKRWQAVAVGCTFAVVAFATLFMV